MTHYKKTLIDQVEYAHRKLISFSFILLLILVVTTFSAVANAVSPMQVGYRDFAYGPGSCSSNPTAEKPESKLWWNDGFWWGSLCDGVTGDYFIYRLDLTDQTWVNTGTALDPRGGSRADVLWDGDKLYVASHEVQQGGIIDPNDSNWARLYRYSYNPTTDTYTPDNLGSLPGLNYAHINNAKSETLTLAKDSTGQLWATYTISNTVTINRSLDGNDGNWGTPFVLPVGGATGISSDDISTVVAFEDGDGNGHIGVMWSNQNTDTIYFASHPDSSDDEVDWTVVSVFADLQANDHINLKSLQSDDAGNVFAVVKTSVSNPAIALLVCEGGSDCTSVDNWVAYPVFQRGGGFEPTRPILLIDEANRDLYIFVASPESGGAIYYKSSPIDNISFPNPAGTGELFIENPLDPAINNPTSTKQNLNGETGLVVLAADASTRYYLHNFLCLDPTGAHCPGTRTLQFDEAEYSVSEADGLATITVTLSAPSAQVITVDYATSDGTAIAPDDYTETAGTLTFDPLETIQTFTIPVTADLLDEPDETVNLALSNAQGAVLGAPSTAVLTILDDDGPPTVQFSAEDFAVNENAGSVTVEVTLSHASTSEVTVNYMTSDGTATAGDDYTAATGSLTFAPSETSQTFEVTILDDALDEFAETLNLALSNPVNATLGAPAEATVTILDDDAAPAVQFSSSTYTVNENSSTATIQVTLSAPSEKPISIEYTTSDGTATADEDYTATSDTLNFTPGQTSQTFTVTILNDGDEEEDETINLALNNPVNAALGEPTTAVLTILDDDLTPIVYFSSNTYTVDENGGVAVITVTLSAPSENIIFVEYATSDGTATAGEDYVATSGTLTFTPGQSSQTFPITILNSEDEEGDETIQVTLSNAVNAILGEPSTATVTIIDQAAQGFSIFLPVVVRN